MIRTYTDDHLVEMHDFFQNAPIGLHILGPDGVIRHANRAALQIVGYGDEPERYIGRGITDFHAEPARADEMFDHWTAGRPLTNFRARLRHRDGGALPVVIYSNSRLENGTLINMRCFAFTEPPAPPLAAAAPARPASDALAALSDVEKRDLFDLLDDFFENAPVALHIVGPDGVIRRANRIELENLGYADEPGRYIGHHIAEFHAEQAVIDDMLERLVGGRPLIHYEAKLIRSDGGKMPVVIYSSPRIESGQFVNTRCFTFPKGVDSASSAPSFGWPREGDGPCTVGETNPLTATLRHLSGIRSARRHAEESLGFLAEVTKAIMASHHYAEAAEAVCRLSVPFLCDWCSIEIESDGEVRPLATARSNGITGSDELVRAAAAGGREREGARYAEVLPFVTRDGARGALLLVRAGERGAFTAPDLALAEEAVRRVALMIEAGQLRDRIEPRGGETGLSAHPVAV